MAKAKEIAPKLPEKDPEVDDEEFGPLPPQELINTESSDDVVSKKTRK